MERVCWGRGGGGTSPLAGASPCSSIPYIIDRIPTNCVTCRVTINWVGSSSFFFSKVPMHLKHRRGTSIPQKIYCCNSPSDPDSERHKCHQIQQMKTKQWICQTNHTKAFIVSYLWQVRPIRAVIRVKLVWRNSAADSSLSTGPRTLLKYTESLSIMPMLMM